jgi:hypothetical protein
MLNNLPIMQDAYAPRRFTSAHPCPICGGHDGLGRGQGIRCFGYLDPTGRYARCTREEKAGSLPQNRDGTYSHRLRDQCRCGQIHGHATAAEGADRREAGARSRRKAQQRFRSYFTLAAYLRSRYGEGTTIRYWTYRDAAGDEAFRVVRVDYRAPDGSKAKSYRPCHRGDDRRWRLSRPDGALPLYKLPSILAAPADAIIAVLEGEKCADLAASIGLPHATTSAHGAQAPFLSDWSPLAGRSVAILQDEGERGAEYAARVAALLASQEPPAHVRVVRLPGLSPGEDIEQWIAARRSAGRRDSELLAELRALIASASP